MIALNSPRLVAVVGAESTGKTTLTLELAEQLNGLAVPEYLREFCDAKQRTPLPHEQRAIVQQQIAIEAAAVLQAKANGATWVLCDSAPLLTAIYSELLFNDTTLLPAALTHHANYSHTLFLQPDIGWQADGIQRDGAHMQAPVSALLKRHLNAANLRFTAITGSGAARTQRAVDALQSPHFPTIPRVALPPLPSLGEGRGEG